MTETPHTSWPKVLVLIGAGVAVALQVGKVPVALPYLQNDLGITLVQAGWIVSIFALIAAPAAAFLGMIANQLGHLRTAVIGLVLTAFAGFVGSTVSDGPPLLASRVAEGLGYWLTATSIPPLIYRVSSNAHRPTALALWSLFLPAGSFVMMVLSGPVLEYSNWRALWVLTSIMVLCATIPVILAGRSLPSPVGTASLGNHLALFLKTGPMIAALAFGLYAAQYFIVAGFLPLILIAEEGFASIAAASVGAGFILMNVFGNLGSSWLHRRGTRSSVLIIIGAALTGTLSVILFNSGLSIEVRILAALCLGAASGLIPSSLFGLIPVLAGSAAAISVMSGMLAQGSALGQLSGPPLAAAAVAQAGSWNAAMPFMVVMALGTVVCGWVLGRQK